MVTNSYGPELLEVFRKASLSPVRIRLKSEKAAIHLRYRFHALRKSMRKEDHYMLSTAESVKFTIRVQEDGSAILSAALADTEFLDALHEAGINVDEANAVPALGAEEEDNGASANNSSDREGSVFPEALKSKKKKV